MTEKEYLAQEEAKRQKAIILQMECAAAQAVAVLHKKQADSIKVTNQATQQQQTYYQQLATFNQQKATDLQQQAKDIQQADKDKQQIQKDVDLALLESRLKALEKVTNEKGDEILKCQARQKDLDDKWRSLENTKFGIALKEKELACREDALKQIIAQFKVCQCHCEHKTVCEDKEAKDKAEKEKKEHTNRSGGGDGTNPGGGGNENGYQNPGFLNHQEKGIVPPKL